MLPRYPEGVLEVSEFLGNVSKKSCKNDQSLVLFSQMNSPTDIIISPTVGTYIGIVTFV